MAAASIRKIKDVIPAHAARIEAKRKELRDNPKKKWTALNPQQKDAILKKLALQADLIEED